MQINLGVSYALYRAQKRMDNFSKFIGNYIYYRKRNHPHRIAWSMAKDTL